MQGIFIFRRLSNAFSCVFCVIHFLSNAEVNGNNITEWREYMQDKVLRIGIIHVSNSVIDFYQMIEFILHNNGKIYNACRISIRQWWTSQNCPMRLPFTEDHHLTFWITSLLH